MDIITNTSQLRTIAGRLGSHYFSPDTLRFFSSRIHAPVYGSRYFVTSEQMRGAYISSGWIPAEPRRYSVRSFELAGDTITFDTLGEFQQYETRDQAHSAARAAARALCTLSPVELTGELSAQ